MLFGGSVVLCLPRLCVLRALKRQRAKHQESVGAKTNREERRRNKSVDRQGEWPFGAGGALLQVRGAGSATQPPKPQATRGVLGLVNPRSQALLNMVKS